MKVLFINNDGAGFAEEVEATEGMTIESFCTQRGFKNASAYLIRVNRQPVTATQGLHSGDRISITPTKIEGAR